MHSDSSLTVGLGDRAYDIIVGRDLLARADNLAAAQLTDRHVIIITDSQVAGYHLDSLASACTRVARRCDTLTITAGEASQTLADAHSWRAQQARARQTFRAGRSCQ